MRAGRSWALLAASLVAIAFAVGGCGDSPDDNGGSANAPSSESSGGYGY
jgi:hypothetical protein